MSKEEEFNPWQFDREAFDSGRSKVTVERHGHEVSLDRYGISIDGSRVVRDDLKHAKGDPGFEVRLDGTVMYRDTEVASIAEPESGWKPGEVTVWGKDGPNNREREEAGATSAA
ncbi:hypothetical protein ACWC5O_45200 [Streptomyces sp. NPDC001450]